jgi:ectoine hydroxylase-related dioxygenase (phytanoyl-CoA dioxygenase family)
MADICRATIGPDVYMAWEQYVVKAAEAGLKFAWHQDSAYAWELGADPTVVKGLSCWCALDDMTEENGTVYILPYDKAGHGKLAPHRPRTTSSATSATIPVSP